jgi:hypothetical protein
LIAAADLELPGLASIEGGRHPGWGTANRIVPLGDAYLELVAVVDEAEAAQSAFGRWVAGAPEGPLGWAVRTDRLDEVAARLGLAVSDGSRVRRDGRLIQWRLAGVDEAAAEPCLPFFIEWAPGTTLPGHGHEGRIDGLELVGDAARLRDWLGDHDLPITVRSGPPAVAAIDVYLRERSRLT